VSGQPVRNRVELRASGLTRRFGLRTIFSRISFDLQHGETLGITGKNGSGKSTLLKILANVAERNEGDIHWQIDDRGLSGEELPRHMGFVSPYLQLYTEFTAWEHFELMQDMRGLDLDAGFALELLERFNLAGRRHDRIQTFSSGMIQRVKIICALVHRPSFLMLDEPTTNLDIQGIETLREILNENGLPRVTLIATNDPADLELCSSSISVETGLATKVVPHESIVPGDPGILPGLT
jgi:heme exporter protein A